MTPTQIAQLRKELNLGQPQFGQLLGVHPMTISKWERGIISPNLYQQTLMTEFKKSAKTPALWLLLKNAQF